MRILSFFAVVILLLPLNYQVLSQDYTWEKPLIEKLEKMADSLSANLKPWVVPDTVFIVEKYGAVGNGTTLNTLAIQKAIDSCSAAGGGVVLFSSGDYVTGTLRIKSGVMLEVSKGSRILGSINLVDYPEIIEDFKSVMSENHQYRQSLIYAEKASNIGIRGMGKIYFRGEKANFPGDETVGKIIGRPFGIRMIQCSNFVMEDITLENAAAWMQSYLACNNMIFDRMKVHSDANYNNDGLDIDGCNGVIVRNSFIFSEDDAMCFKGCSGLPTQNVLVENSTFVTTCNAFKIGTDTQGPFRNIIARNLVLGGVPDSINSERGHQASTGITLATVDGGNVEDIYISNVTIDQARCPVFIRIGNRRRVMPGAPTPPVGYLKNVLIEGVDGKRNYRQGSYIAGIAGHKVENIIIRDYNIEMEGGGTLVMAGTPVAENEGGYPDAHQFSVNGLPAYGFYINHAANVWFDTVKTNPVNADYRPEFITGNDAQNIIANGIAVKKQEILVFNYTPKYFKDVTINNSANKYKIDSTYVGAMLYTDRTYGFTALCDSIAGSEYLCLQNGLKSVYSENLVSFSFKVPGKLFIAHDDRLAKPEWLKKNYTEIDQHLPVPGTQMTLFERNVDKDQQIILGENQVKGTETGECTLYLVFFVAGESDDSSTALTNQTTDGFGMFPNPTAKGHIELIFDAEDNYKVTVYDISGKQMLTESIFGERISLNTEYLLNGFYTLLIESNSLTRSAQFIVQ